MVQKLKLNFATTDDYNSIMDFFSSDRKLQADPNGYIRTRKDEYLRNSLSTRSSAFITTADTNDIVYFTATYKIFEGDIVPSTQHLYTEAGSSISLFPGFGSTAFVGSLLILKEWLFMPPKELIISRIREQNKAAIIARNKIMGWNIIQDEELIETLKEKCKKSCNHGNEDCPKDVLWFCMEGEGIIQKHANLALRVIDRGALMNKEGDIKPIDFKVIDEVGLTEKRLIAMAKGETNRKKILSV